MPHIDIAHFPRPPEPGATEALVSDLTALICRHFKVPSGAVSIALRPVASDDWQASVYGPQIMGRDRPFLVKSPDY